MVAVAPKIPIQIDHQWILVGAHTQRLQYNELLQSLHLLVGPTISSDQVNGFHMFTGSQIHISVKK